MSVYRNSLKHGYIYLGKNVFIDENTRRGLMKKLKRNDTMVRILKYYPLSHVDLLPFNQFKSYYY